MARSAKRRTSRKPVRRKLRRNPLERKQKLLIAGGAIAVVGVGALVVMRSMRAPELPPPPPTGPALSPGDAATAQCNALQQQLFQARAVLNPDPPSLRRLESQLATCIQQARAAGADVPNSMSNLSDGDQGFQHIEDQFADYKRTEYSDALKRNNIRQDMLSTGASMASAYANAANAATDDSARNAIRQSIVRALDSAMNRKVCYQYDQPGCGRFGVNEDHGNDKAAQEWSRVIQPLIDAHVLVAGQLQAPLPADNENYAAVRVRPAAAAFARADAKFNEYKGVPYDDALRRNNLRQEVLGSGIEGIHLLSDALPELLQNRLLSAAGLRAARDALLAALRSSYMRWICYLTGTSGCGTFAANEDSPQDKAGQEWASVIAPLQVLYARVASALLSEYSEDAYTPYIQLRLNIAKSLGDYITAKWTEYKGVNYADPVRRNNIRGVFTTAEALLAGFLADTMTLATNAATTAPVTRTQTSRCPDGSVVTQTWDNATQRWVADRQCPQQPAATGLELGAGGCVAGVRGGGPGAYNTWAPAGVRTSTGAVVPGTAGGKQCAQCHAPAIFIPGVVGADGFWVTPPGCLDPSTGRVAGVPSTGPCPQGTTRNASGACVRVSATSITPAAASIIARPIIPLNLTPSTAGLLGLGGYEGPAIRGYATGLGQASAPTSSKPTAGAAVQTGYGAALVKQVVQAIYTALDAATIRWGCFVIKADGCDKSGSSEPDNWAKADWELANVITPLFASLDTGVNWLLSSGDKASDVQLTQAKLKRCILGHQLAIAKWNEYNSTSSADLVRRSEQDAHARAIEQKVIDCINSIAPKTPAGAAEVAKVLQAWKTEFKSYPPSYDEALTRFRNAAASGSTAGLGQATWGGMSSSTWLGVGAVALLGGALLLGSGKMPRRNTRRRRTSRRATL